MLIFSDPPSLRCTVFVCLYQLTSDIAIFGPAATVWFSFLQRNVVFKSNKATIAARVAADQGLFGPLNISCFLTSMAVMEGADPIEKWKSSFLPVYKANLTVWPMVQTINFAFVPLEYRVLLVNFISLGKCRSQCCCEQYSLIFFPGWNCFLSLISSGDK